MAPLLAFTADQVHRLTGLSDRQLRYWDDSGFFRPAYAGERRGRPYGRVYSFTDVVALRTLALLRNSYNVPRQQLCDVAARLADYAQDDNPWLGRRFWVAGRQVVFEDPVTGAPVSGRRRQQAVLPIDLQEVACAAEADAQRLVERTPDQIGTIARQRDVLHNASVIAGTRIPTSAVWTFHEAGYDTDAIIREYPRLHPEDVMAAIAHEQALRQAAVA